MGAKTFNLHVPRRQDAELLAAIERAGLHPAFVCDSGDGWTTIATGTPEDEDECAAKLSAELGPLVSLREYDAELFIAQLLDGGEVLAWRGIDLAEDHEIADQIRGPISAFTPLLRRSVESDELEALLSTGVMARDTMRSTWVDVVVADERASGESIERADVEAHVEARGSPDESATRASNLGILGSRFAVLLGIAPAAARSSYDYVEADLGLLGADSEFPGLTWVRLG